LDFISALFSKNLLALRKAGGFSQSEVAIAVNVAQASYSRWESGANFPDTQSIEKLAQFYGVRSSRFFYDPDMEKPSELPQKTLTNKEIKALIAELASQIK
jgi:transcriptional regulator with XRE-family HTH domain